MKIAVVKVMLLVRILDSFNRSSSYAYFCVHDDISLKHIDYYFYIGKSSLSNFQLHFPFSIQKSLPWGVAKAKGLSKNKKSSSEKNKNKKSKDGGGLASMGGLTSLLGALHEEPSSRPQSNIFTDNLDQDMMEAYTQPPTMRSASTGSESAGSTASLTPNAITEAPVFNLPNANDRDSENVGGTKYSLIHEIAKEYERVHNGGLSNGDMNNNILEATTPRSSSDNKELINGDIHRSSVSSLQSEGEINENKTKKPRKLIKVTLTKTSKGKNFLSGKEYTI